MQSLRMRVYIRIETALLWINSRSGSAQGAGIKQQIFPPVEWHKLYSPLNRVCQAPHEAIEHVMWHWSSVEISHYCLDDTGVSLIEALPLCLLAQFTYDILMKERENLSFLKCDQMRVHWRHLPKESSRTTRGHVISPWGGCWVISSKIAEFWYYTSIPYLMYIIIKYKNI